MTRGGGQLNPPPIAEEYYCFIAWTDETEQSLHFEARFQRAFESLQIFLRVCS